MWVPQVPCPHSARTELCAASAARARSKAATATRAGSDLKAVLGRRHYPLGSLAHSTPSVLVSIPHEHSTGIKKTAFTRAATVLSITKSVARESEHREEEEEGSPSRAVRLPSDPAAMNIFKKKVDPKEALRTSKREMAVATRGVEREIGSLQMEEKKLVAEIKKTAKTGNEAATKILARQLVRLRQQIINLQGTRAQIRGVATHTQAMYAGTSISAGMKGASKAMAAMNKQMEPAKQIKVMREFQKQSTQLDMTLEMMSDAIDETLDKDEAEEETEELTNQVLDEIGVDVASQLSSAPKGHIGATNKKVDNSQARNAAAPARNVAPPESSAEVDDLERRLASLRRL